MAVCVIAALWVFYCCVSAQCALKRQYLQYLTGAQTLRKYYAILTIHCQLQITDLPGAERL